MFLHIISRSTAKSIGLKRYFTGNPCVNNSISQRMSSNGQCLCEICVDKNKARQKKWRDENHDLAMELTRNWRERNKDHIREYANNRYKNLPSEKKEMLLQINREYYRNNKDAASAYQKDYRAKNKHSLKRRWKEWYKENRDHVLNYQANYRANNADLISARDKIYRSKNLYAISERQSLWHVNNRDMIINRVKEWAKNNPEKAAANRSKRRVIYISSSRLSMDEFSVLVFQEAFLLRIERSKQTGIIWHVDHMIPLRAKNACGLHVWNNIQVIPAVMNLSKKNKMQLTEPLEWLKA